MKSHSFLRSVLRMAMICLLLYVAFVAFLFFFQRSLLYFPSNRVVSSRLTPWVSDEETIGYCRKVKDADRVWLMMHGNAGQAADRDYVIARLPKRDSLFVLEYPGYGSRPGRPSRQAFNDAAAEAYQVLRTEYPETPICVLGESIGSGPACSLAGRSVPPDKITLVVPFDSLADVASNRFYFVPVGWLLLDNWNNIQALRGYEGPVEIFGATQDRIIPVHHARTLADQVPTAKFRPVTCGHNEWASCAEISIR